MRLFCMFIILVAFAGSVSTGAKQVLTDETTCEQPTRIEHEQIDQYEMLGSGQCWHGDLLLVGSSGGSVSGGARLYDMRNPDDPILISEIIMGEDFFTGSSFLTRAVALTEHHAFIADVLDDDLRGAVWVYDISMRADPVHIQTLYPPDPGDRLFGEHIIANSDSILINAPASSSDHIYQYVMNERGLYELHNTITVPTHVDNASGFGHSMFLTDQWLIVGAPNHYVEKEPGQGAVHFFARVSPVDFYWTHFLFATSDSPGVFDFGSELFMKDDLLAVTSPSWPISFAATGRVSLYDVSTIWEPEFLAAVYPEDSAFGDPDGFGNQIKLVGDTLVIACPSRQTTVAEGGEIYFYDISDRSNPILDQISHPDAQSPGENFGVSLGFSGNTLTVGAVRSSFDTFLGGAVYVYEDCQFPGLCLSDIDENGTVDTADLIALLFAYGTDGDGAAITHPVSIVDTTDLLELLFSWGPCQ